MDARNDITAERVRELLDYDPETGVFLRKVKTKRQKVGDRADGPQASGYLQVYLDRKQYLAHRIAWLYMTSEWPKAFVDHINGNKCDNRFANLREANMSLNQQNIKRAQKNNKCGFLGVIYSAERRKWVSKIRIDGKYKYLGQFDSPELAHQAYLDAKRKHHIGNTL